MNQFEIENHLKTLNLGGIRFFQTTTSTNAEALGWIEDGCPDLALVIADEQTAGRGRGGRKWFTPSESALALSLVMRTDSNMSHLLENHNMTRFNGLGALAVCKAVQKIYNFPAKIKWPNDILVNGKKLAGVLVEAQWIGNELVAIVLGIGINVATKSVPPVNWDPFNPHPFPATCIESILGTSVSRLILLYAVLEELLIWRKQLSNPEFLQVWQQNLAFKDEWVQVLSPGDDNDPRIVQIVGLKQDGTLQIRQKSGELSSIRIGEIHPFDPPFGGFRLRPVDR